MSRYAGESKGGVVVLGSFITDLVARAPRLPLPGEAVIGDEFGTFQGGKGFNQAIAAARLGANVTLIGRVGSDTYGDSFFAVLAQEHIDSEHVIRDSTEGTGLACVMIGGDSGQNSIIVLPRANLAITARDVEEAMDALLSSQASPAHGSVFMAQCEMRMATVAAGLRIASEAGVTTIFNLAPIPQEPLGEEIFTFVDILIVNESEGASLANISIDSPTTAQEAAERLLLRGPKHIIITLGKEGSIWSTYELDSGQVMHQEIRTLPVKQVDATAAGDASCGALAAKLSEGMPMTEALRWATAAGAVTVTRMGAFPSLPSAREVEALLQKSGGS